MIGQWWILGYWLETPQKFSVAQREPPCTINFHQVLIVVLFFHDNPRLFPMPGVVANLVLDMDLGAHWQGR